MKSIKLKIVLIYLALVFIVMLASGAFTVVSIRLQEIKKVELDLISQCKYINSDIIRAPENSNIEFQNEEEFQNALTTYFRTNNMNTTREANILDARGYIIATTAPEQLQKPGTNYASYSVVIQAMAGNARFSNSRWGFDMNSLLKERKDYAYPVKSDTGEVKYIIFVRSSLDEIEKRLSDIANTITISVILALILTSVLGVLFANTITGPIILLTKKSMELATGRLDEKIEVKSKDEIGQLTESFNNMSSELKYTLETMSIEKNKLEILLQNMTDGVLAYDHDGRLIHANNSSLELLSIVSFENVSFQEMIKKLGVKKDEVQSLSINNIKEVTTFMGDKFISSFTPYFNKYNQLDGIVIVIQDITKHIKLDNMRKEFVANVSHEIRTPLTNIKSYTETLLDGAIEQKEIANEFLNIIDKEADRMALLVKDLLELSRFDNKQFALELVKVDLVVLIQISIRQMQILADKNNQTIHFLKPNEEYFIEADSARINQVFINIIGNSIKYSTENGTITIYIEKSEKFYQVYIKDTGVGIPKEDLKNIFERFYRVDKARSRAMGGTGLGLSIAKEIIEAHGGSVSVNSELGKGTTMIIRFNRLFEILEEDN